MSYNCVLKVYMCTLLLCGPFQVKLHGPLIRYSDNNNTVMITCHI